MQALLEKSHALIDCGALMAGATNRQVAEYACQSPLLDPKLFKGVVFFDQDHQKWMAMECRCTIHWPKKRVVGFGHRVEVATRDMQARVPVSKNRFWESAGGGLRAAGGLLNAQLSRNI
jgi:hypothetical protein